MKKIILSDRTISIKMNRLKNNIQVSAYLANDRPTHWQHSTLLGICGLKFKPLIVCPGRVLKTT